MDSRTAARGWPFVTCCLGLLLPLAAAAADFRPGQIVLVRHYGKMEEARVGRQDEHGVLVQWKDWQDGTFHDDPATAPTEYRQPDELKPRGTQAQPPDRPPQPGAGGQADDAPPPHQAPPTPRVPPPAPVGGDPGGTAGAVPDGEYYCYTYHPNPVVAGVFTIAGGAYRTRTGASGRYRLAGGGRIEWLGTPPLGFQVGVLEETDPRPKIRMYPLASDIGNKWKAAVCTPREGGAAAPGQTGGGNAVTAAFPPGAKVWYSFLGHWYKATVVSCSGARCHLHYDDPKYPDETVDAKELQAR